MLFRSNAMTISDRDQGHHDESDGRARADRRPNTAGNCPTFGEVAGHPVDG